MTAVTGSDRGPALRPLSDGGWCAIGVVAWLLRYAEQFGIGAGVPHWAGWFDQGRYLRSATAFAHGSIDAAAHWYPLGYPLLAAPFVALLPSDPFLPLDALLFVATLIGFQRAMATIGVDRTTGGIVFLTSTLAQGKIARLWLDPWTTSLSAALLWWSLALALRLPRTRTPRVAMLLGASLGGLVAVRPVDMLPAAIIGLSALCALRRRSAHAALLIGAAAGVCLLYVLLHLAIYGPHLSAYMILSKRMGFVFSDLGWKAYTLLVTPAPWFPDCRSIAEAAPWTVIGMAGLLARLAVSDGPARRALALILGVAAAYMILFLCYADLLPTGLWHYNNAHYFKWLFPLAGMGVVALARASRTRRGRLAVAAVTLVLAAIACIRVVPVRVGDAVPARMVLFRDRVRPWAAVYFGPLTLIDRSGSLTNVIDYHAIPDGARIRAIAIRRPIAAGARLRDPADRMPDRPADARYAERIEWGVPCRLDRMGCAVR